MHGALHGNGAKINNKDSGPITAQSDRGTGALGSGLALETVRLILHKNQLSLD